MFYVSAITVAIATGLLFAIQESRPSLILSREVAKLRKVTGNDTLHALNPDHTPDMPTFTRLMLFRPLHLFFTEPIVCLVAVMSAITQLASLSRKWGGQAWFLKTNINMAMFWCK